MKILLNVLYVTVPDTYLSLDGENVVLQKGKDGLKRVPLHNLESIVTFSYSGASPALMGACAKRNIAISFLTQSGKFLCRVVGEPQGNVILRKSQYIFSEDEEKCVEIASNMLIGKIYNSRWVLERAARDYSLRLDVDKLKNISGRLYGSIPAVQNSASLETLRGIEGKAAVEYFSVFDDLILHNKEDFYFHERNKRPPLDNVNALLSFVYTLLAHDVAAALNSVGLDPYVGFLHRDRPGRISLALDLMEELRPVFADRFVLTLINLKQITAKGFIKKENGAVVMDDETRRAVLSAWQKRKMEPIKHPFLNEKIEWGLVPYVQSLLLARYIRGDIDGYPPFLWK